MMAEDAVNGVFNPEVFAWARHMYATLDETICTNRNIMPRPPSVISNLKNALQNGNKTRILFWLQDNLIACSAKDATPKNVIIETIKAGFGADSSMLTSVGLGIAAYSQYRVGPKKDWFVFFKWQVTAINAAVPVQLKGYVKA
jgi:hypothetical protein